MGSVALEEDLAADDGEVHAGVEDLVVGAGEDVLGEDDDVGEMAEIPKVRPMARNRRVSVSAESGGRDKLRMSWEARGKDKGTEKSPGETARIRAILDKNIMFAFLDESQLKKLTFAMFQRDHAEGDVIIQQGDQGDNFYLLEEGTCDVFVQKSPGEPEVKVMTCTPDDHNSFGELALMYNAPRAATVKAAGKCKLWALDRLAFKVIMLETAVLKNSEHAELLNKVKIMETVTDMERKVIADAMSMETFEAGQIIIRQGDPGTAFYIVASGTVACTMQASESSPPEELCQLSEGEYFVSAAAELQCSRQRGCFVPSFLSICFCASHNSLTQPLCWFCFFFFFFFFSCLVCFFAGRDCAADGPPAPGHRDGRGAVQGALPEPKEVSTRHGPDVGCAQAQYLGVHSSRVGQCALNKKAVTFGERLWGLGTVRGFQLGF